VPLEVTTAVAQSRAIYLNAAAYRFSGEDRLGRQSKRERRLLDGSRAYVHAAIDNFSRRILAWRVADAFASVKCGLSDVIDGPPEPPAFAISLAST
jgi:hypothetical protein